MQITDLSLYDLKEVKESFKLIPFKINIHFSAVFYFLYKLSKGHKVWTAYIKRKLQIDFGKNLKAFCSKFHFFMECERNLQIGRYINLCTKDKSNIFLSF